MMSAQRMSYADVAWLHMDRPTNLMIVNSLLWFDEPVDVDRTKEILRVRLVERLPRFRQRVTEPRLGIGLPAWEDDPYFDLDRHIHHRGLPAPGDKRALERLVGDLVASPLDRSKPLWDFYMIEGYRAGMAMIARIHHCIADGIALSRVLLSLTDAQSDSGIALSRHVAGGRGLLGTMLRPVRVGTQLAHGGVREGMEILAHPTSELPARATRANAGASTLAKQLLTRPDAKTVLTSELGVGRKVTWSERVPLAEVKAIGAATGTTVNDVLVASLTGALRRYLHGRDSLVDEIRTFVPYNLRPLDEPLPRELGNRFGLVNLTLPVGLGDPARRLAEVHSRMQAIKESPEGRLSFAILELIGRTPRQVEQRLVDLFAAQSTATMTNVPGPRDPLYFAGTRIAGVVSWVPTAGSVGIGMNIFTYNGAVTVGLQVDAGLVPDPETIIAGYEDELAELARLADAGSRDCALASR